MTNPATTPTADGQVRVPIGVGIDTSRYGHYAAFLHHHNQVAAAALPFSESATGYAQLRGRLQQIAQRHTHVSFHIRVDAAGQYADNLLHFLQQLVRDPQTQTCAIPLCTISLSWGDPQRNKNYRVALWE
jgi:hypothetical protein